LQEACGLDYLALRALDGYLLVTGTPHNKLPTSLIEIERVLQKIAGNSKIMNL
jgi:hypothetical protein